MSVWLMVLAALAVGVLLGVLLMCALALSGDGCGDRDARIE